MCLLAGPSAESLRDGREGPQLVGLENKRIGRSSGVAASIGYRLSEELALVIPLEERRL